jgi:uncharacterized protein YcbX
VRTVAALSITPVKSLGLLHPSELELTEVGVRGNRQFYLVDADGKLVGGVKHGTLVQVAPELDGERLTLRFPDGTVVADDVCLGSSTTTDFYGRPVAGTLVLGPWADALSAYAGSPLQLVRADDDDAWDVEPATLVSLASCDRLSEQLDGAEIDHRRFRMLLTLDGCEAHEEDTWSGGRLSVGDAILRVGGPVPRCAVTTQDPATGIRSLDTLRAIKGYRGVRDGKRIDFGVYAQVEQPGRVRVGDSVEPL